MDKEEESIGLKQQVFVFPVLRNLPESVTGASGLCFTICASTHGYIASIIQPFGISLLLLIPSNTKYNACLCVNSPQTIVDTRVRTAGNNQEILVDSIHTASKEDPLSLHQMPANGKYVCNLQCPHVEHMLQ